VLLFSPEKGLVASAAAAVICRVPGGSGAAAKTELTSCKASASRAALDGPAVDAYAGSDVATMADVAASAISTRSERRNGLERRVLNVFIPYVCASTWSTYSKL
jgi:lysozyme family protein